jgi:hypothetical protein
MDEMGSPVVAVVGASGGIGASTFAAALATAAADARGFGTLLDLDDRAGGIDVLLGAEDVDGPRWSGLRLAGGHLDPTVLAASLPRWGAAAFVSADVGPAAAVLSQTIDVARRLGPVVLDLPRWSGAVAQAVVADCALLILVAGSYVSQVTAARVAAVSLTGCPAGLVVRLSGDASPERVAELVGLPLIGVLPERLRRSRGDEALRPDGVVGGVQRTARGVLDALDRELVDA